MQKKKKKKPTGLLASFPPQFPDQMSVCTDFILNQAQMLAEPIVGIIIYTVYNIHIPI